MARKKRFNKMELRAALTVVEAYSQRSSAALFRHPPIKTDNLIYWSRTLHNYNREYSTTINPTVNAYRRAIENQQRDTFIAGLAHKIHEFDLRKARPKYAGLHPLQYQPPTVPPTLGYVLEEFALIKRLFGNLRVVSGILDRNAATRPFEKASNQVQVVMAERESPRVRRTRLNPPTIRGIRPRPGISPLSLVIRTKRITLEDDYDMDEYDNIDTEPTGRKVDLGRFDMVLPLTAITHPGHGSYPSGEDWLVVAAEDPHPSNDGSNITHPHVQGSHICTGEGGAAIIKAMRECRIADAAELISVILETYNPGSPYMYLRDWDRIPCPNCGSYTTDEELSRCERCEGERCPRCMAECQACHLRACHGCLIEFLTESGGRAFVCEDHRAPCPDCLNYTSKDMIDRLGCCHHCNRHRVHCRRCNARVSMNTVDNAGVCAECQLVVSPCGVCGRVCLTRDLDVNRCCAQCADEYFACVGCRAPVLRGVANASGHCENCAVHISNCRRCRRPTYSPLLDGERRCTNCADVVRRRRGDGGSGGEGDEPTAPSDMPTAPAATTPADAQTPGRRLDDLLQATPVLTNESADNVADSVSATLNVPVPAFISRDRQIRTIDWSAMELNTLSYFENLPADIERRFRDTAIRAQTLSEILSSPSNSR